jgi:GNAT superfamily N-acetyltransferase
MNPFKTRFFKHYKNKPYKYLGLVRHSETLEELALYETLYPNDLGKLWVRPKDMFFENVIIDGVKRPRFAPTDFTYKKFEDVDSLPLADIAQIYEKCFQAKLDEAEFLKKVDERSNLLVLLAYDKELPVAMKVGYAIDKATFHSWKCGVIPEYRKLGLASELMRSQHKWCEGWGFKKLQTLSRNESIDMIKLNLNAGFKVTGTTPSDKGLKINFEKVLS